MIQEVFDELKHTGQLPSPSGVGMRILVLTQDEGSSLAEIVQTIQADPALSGRILRLANSVQLTGRSSIGTVSEAAVRLGLRSVANVALGFTLISGNRSGRCGKFDYDKYWSWSLANALVAQAISRELSIGVPAEAFTCALLCRIGRLALASVHPTEYAEVLTRLEREGAPDLVELEREHFRIQHREVAAAMMADWGLPDAYGEAALALDGSGGLPQMENVKAFDLLRLLNAAGMVADLWVSEEERQPSFWGALKHVCEQLEVTPEEFGKLFERVVPEWKEWGKLLEVPTNNVMSNADLERHCAEEAAASKAAQAFGDQDYTKGLRILAVDDDPISLRLLVKHLELAGHRVLTATNGKEALAIALESSPQIVITDWMMPEMDGIELCKTLRRFAAGRNLYILILTGRDEEDRVVEAFEAGADDYVTKPFKPKLLLARIRGGQRVVRLQDQVERDKRLQREQVAKLAVMTRKLRSAAMTDALTDLPNRRYAMKRLEMEWANSQRAALPFSVVALDVDHFKLVNDAHGHDVGDIVLQAVSKAIGRTLRRGDTCARMGGEEFLVLCPNTDSAGALYVAERIRSSVERTPIVAGGFDGRITVSLGVATRVDWIPSIDALLKAADEAVYEAKRGGRNRIACAAPDARDSESA